MVQQHYDYVIVGAGSAGCALANRLSADPRKSVLLVEAGPRDLNPFIKIPAGISKTFMHPTLNWGYMTEPQEQLGGRSIYWPRGRTLGGSSAINGMIYIRGQAEDYDAWERGGCAGWGWRDILPVYRAIESHEDGENEWHGGDGELRVSHARFRHPTGDIFLQACKAAGYPLTRDFNGADQHGADYYQFTIRNGVRASSASAFLAPIRGRKNLTVTTGVHVQRLLLEGAKVTGVAVQMRGRSRVIGAGEVILCAGALNSPQLLMLSGIGPAAHLREHGIDVVLDLPGVGENLHDHVLVQHLAETDTRLSINRQMKGARLLPEIVRYVLTRNGLLTIGASQIAAFLKSKDELDRPDVQIMFKPYVIEMGANGRIAPSTRPGWTTAASPLRPTSRGWIKLRNADWRTPPLMHPRLLDTEEDRALTVEGVRMMRRIFAASPLHEIAHEYLPGSSIESESELLAYVRANANSVYHPVGTCKMGTSSDAVVDPSLRVRGIEGLRVADASIMPSIISGNTNAASIMIGAKAADIIRSAR
ncbi:choline dehydrogenase [Sphingobium lactosutens]|nr:GMC family oxidoreductase N-terminal domain-containing protein [Sphingobium lactosutens]NWK97393.1 choline dehydrogenase [Sphingobium lactosutens]